MFRPAFCRALISETQVRGTGSNFARGSSRQAPQVRELLRHTWSGFKKGPPTAKNSGRHEQGVKELADYAISDRTAV